MIQAAYPQARFEPQISAPADIAAQRSWTREHGCHRAGARAAAGTRPVTARDLVESLHIEPSAWPWRWPSSRARASCCAAASAGGHRARSPATGRRHARVVRAPAAGPHPSLHHQDTARGDRTGFRRRFHALPARMAGRHAHAANRRASKAWTRSSSSSRATRFRPPPGRATCSRRGSTTTTRTGWTACASRAAHCGRACSRRNPPVPRRYAARRSRWSRAATGPCGIRWPTRHRTSHSSRTARVPCTNTFDAWRFFLRRHGRRHQSAALPGGDSAG